MFGTLIREYRKSLNISQEEMAYKLCISSNHLSRIERGKVYPSGYLINKIIKMISYDVQLEKISKIDQEFYGIIMLIKLESFNEDSKQIIFNEFLRLCTIIESLYKAQEEKTKDK